MNLRTISVVALSNRDFDSLKEKIAEAARWVELAGAQGAELVVLPEHLSRYGGDGAGNPRARSFEELVVEDWREEMRPLVEVAERLGIYVTVPVIHQREGRIFNSLILVSPEGRDVWTYDKISPTPEELDKGVTPGETSFYDWKGVKLGGAICFDTCFPENLEQQAQEGVQLFLVPSLWPGGSQLNHVCKLCHTRMALAYPAWSRIIDIDGEDVVAGGYRQESLRFGFGAPVYTATLNFDRVALYGNHNQGKMAAVLGKYGRRVRVTFDQENCLWFLESRDPALAEQSIIAEFELISARDYFEYCKHRITAAKL